MVINMDKKCIDGKKIAAAFLKETGVQIASLRKQGIAPSLVVICVGDNPSSHKYVKAKVNSCKKLNIEAEQVFLPANITESELLIIIESYNRNDKVHGILVQLPLPAHIDAYMITAAIDPRKDVDGLNPINVGKLVMNQETFIPCTPLGILVMLRAEKITIAGKHVVIMGRSQIVGKPLGILLLRENATVTYVHSFTENLATYTKQADIIAVAVGSKHILTANMVKKGAVVIDVGINEVNNELFGDVKYDEVYEVAQKITPVPGGVGPMTVASLMANTVRAAEKMANRD